MKKMDRSELLHRNHTWAAISGGSDTAKTEGLAKDVTDSMRRLKKNLADELDKSLLNYQILERSTKRLQSTNKQYEQFNGVLATTKATLKDLWRKERSDQFWISAAFGAFISMAVYILWQRLRISSIFMLLNPVLLAIYQRIGGIHENASTSDYTVTQMTDVPMITEQLYARESAFIGTPRDSSKESVSTTMPEPTGLSVFTSEERPTPTIDTTIDTFVASQSLMAEQTAPYIEVTTPITTEETAISAERTEVEQLPTVTVEPVVTSITDLATGSVESAMTDDVNLVEQVPTPTSTTDIKVVEQTQDPDQASAVAVEPTAATIVNTPVEQVPEQQSAATISPESVNEQSEATIVDAKEGYDPIADSINIRTNMNDAWSDHVKESDDHQPDTSIVDHDELSVDEEPRRSSELEAEPYISETQMDSDPDEADNVPDGESTTPPSIADKQEL